MTKIIVGIKGMMCGMCEAHTNDAIRNAFGVNEVISSYEDGQTIIIAKEDIEDSKIKGVVEGIGYEVIDIKREEYKKKGVFSSLFKK